MHMVHDRLVSRLFHPAHTDGTAKRWPPSREYGIRHQSTIAGDRRESGCSVSAVADVPETTVERSQLLREAVKYFGHAIALGGSREQFEPLLAEAGAALSGDA